MKSSNLPLRNLAIHGGIFMGGAQVCKIIIQFLSVILLSRLLDPSDFGLVASVSPVIAFVGMFQDLGLQQAIIQRENITSRQLNQIFWILLLASVICTSIIIISSSFIANFYEDDRIYLICILSAFPMFLFAFSSVPVSLLNRGLKFKHLAIIDVLSAFLGFFVAFISAYLGAHYWALIIGAFSSALTNMVLAWFFSRWIPSRPDFKMDRDILNFGSNLTGFNIFNFMSRNLDNVLIGKYSGSDALGYYDRAYKLLLFPIQNFTNPISKVILPLLCRVNNDDARHHKIYVKSATLMCYALIPGICALTVIPDTVITLFFGERWLPVAPIFQWLGLAALFQPLNNSTGWLFISRGRTDVMFKWGIFSSVVVILSFLIGLQWGAVGVAAAYSLTNIFILTPILLYTCHRIGSIKLKDFVSILLPHLLASITTFLLIKAISNIFLNNDLILIIFTVGTSYILATLSLFLTHNGRETIYELLNTLKLIKTKIEHEQT